LRPLMQSDCLVAGERMQEADAPKASTEQDKPSLETAAHDHFHQLLDALPLAHSPLILKADREEQFGPVKNPVGVDSVESCRALLLARATRWLEAAGIPVPRTSDGTPICRIELSPRRFLDPEDVRVQASRIAPPKPGEVKVYE